MSWSRPAPRPSQAPARTVLSALPSTSAAARVGALDGVEPLLLTEGSHSSLGLASCFELRRLQVLVSDLVEARLQPVLSPQLVEALVEDIGESFAVLHEACKQRKQLLAEEELRVYGASAVEAAGAIDLDEEEGGDEGGGYEAEAAFSSAEEESAEEEEPAAASSSSLAAEPWAPPQLSRKERRAQRSREYRKRGRGEAARPTSQPEGARKRRR